MEQDTNPTLTLSQNKFPIAINSSSTFLFPSRLQPRPVSRVSSNFTLFPPLNFPFFITLFSSTLILTTSHIRPTHRNPTPIPTTFNPTTPKHPTPTKPIPPITKLPKVILQIVPKITNDNAPIPITIKLRITEMMKEMIVKRIRMNQKRVM